MLCRGRHRKLTCPTCLRALCAASSAPARPASCLPFCSCSVPKRSACPHNSLISPDFSSSLELEAFDRALVLLCRHWERGWGWRCHLFLQSSERWGWRFALPSTTSGIRISFPSLASCAARFNHRAAGLVSSTRWELAKACRTPSPVRVSKGQKAQSNARDHWKEILGEKKQWKGGLVHSLWSQTLPPL